MDKDTGLFKTKDLYEAAFLYADRRKLVRLERDGNIFWFVFADRETCERVSLAYWQGEIDTNAKEYADAIRTLKDRIFAQR